MVGNFPCYTIKCIKCPFYVLKIGDLYLIYSIPIYVLSIFFNSLELKQKYLYREIKGQLKMFK